MSSSRKPYLDNIRWATVVLVVIYHVIYMFNGVQPLASSDRFGSISSRMVSCIWSIPGSWHCCSLCRA